MSSLLCSMYVHVRSDVSNIWEIFDILRLTCLIPYTYGEWCVEYFWNFRHMADDMFKPYTYGEWCVEYFWNFRHMVGDMFNPVYIWRVMCRRFQKFSTYGRRSVPATSRSQACRRLFSVGAEVGCSGRELLYFAGIFFWKSAPPKSPCEKKRFYGLFLRFCLHLWVLAVTLRRVMRYLYLCGGPTFG